MKAVVVHGGAKGLAFVRDLVADGVETYLLHGKHPCFAAAFLGVRPSLFEFVRDSRLDSEYPDPRSAPDAFRAAVLRQLELIRPEIVFPVNAAEITALYPARGEIERLGIVFPFGDEARYHALRDKSRLPELFPEALPETRVLEGTWFAKPCRETSAKGVRRVGEDGPWVLQREFRGFGVGFEALVDRGDVKTAFMHRRLREYPASGGASTARVSYWDDAVAARAHEILGRSGWTGFIMVEFRQNAAGEFRLIEINPRPWGSIQLAIDAGVRFPSVAYRYFVQGQAPPARGNREGLVETRVVPYDVLSGLQHFARGEARPLADALSLWKRFRWEAFRPLDPRHVLLNFFFLYDGLKAMLPRPQRERR